MEIKRVFVLEDRFELVSRQELIEKFYRLNVVRKSESKLPIFRRTALKPIALVYNPAGFKHSMAMDDDVVIAVYYGRFFVKIEQKGLAGPHTAYLLYQVKTGDHVWLATAQVAGSFHNEKLLQIELKELIVDKGYFCSPKKLEEGIKIPLDN